MRAVLLSGMVALATLAIFVDSRAHDRAARATTVKCQDVANVMPQILAAMIKKGPTTANTDLNAFIKVIIEADKAATQSPTQQINKEQFTKFSKDGLTAICAATKTSPANKAMMESLLTQGGQMSPNQNMDTFIKMMGQTVCYLGDGTPSSKEFVTKMFMDFLGSSSASASKTTTTNAGSKSGNLAAAMKAAAAKPAPAKAPAKTPAKTPAKAKAKAAAKTAAKPAPKG